MFDPKSDYALNKLDPKAIVCKSVTGVHIRLTLADFASEEEFCAWKSWSDRDYHDAEKAGRSFYDKGVPMEAHIDQSHATPSIEAEIFSALDDAEAMEKQAKKTAELIGCLKSCLTKTQYRRLRMLYGEKLNVEEIAIREGVSVQTVYECLANARRRIMNDL